MKGYRIIVTVAAIYLFLLIALFMVFAHVQAILDDRLIRFNHIDKTLSVIEKEISTHFDTDEKRFKEIGVK